MGPETLAQLADGAHPDAGESTTISHGRLRPSCDAVG